MNMTKSKGLKLNVQHFTLGDFASTASNFSPNGSGEDLEEIYISSWPSWGFEKDGSSAVVGACRVVFHETINGQRPDDPRRRIVWVAGGTMHRCSVHSVRKVTAQERLDFELHSGEDPSHWQPLASFIPQRSFVDCVPEEPDEDEEDLPQLPSDPSTTALHGPKPMMRHFYKHSVRKVTFAETPAAEAPPVDSYDPSFAAKPDDEGR